MPEGLKVIVDADVQKAIKAFKEVAKEAGNTGAAMTALQKKVEFFGGGINTFTNNFRKLSPALDNAERSLKRLPNTSNQATQSLINLGRVAQDAPFGFLGIANNINPLLESFQRLRASSGTTGGALKALVGSLGGAGGIGLALSVATSAVLLFGDKLGIAAKTFKAADFEAAQLKITIDNLKNTFDNFKASLEFGDFFRSVKAQLAGVKGEDLKIFDADQTIASNKKIIADINRQTVDLDKEMEEMIKKIVARGGEATQLLSGFSRVSDIPENLISKLGETNQRLFEQAKQLADRRLELDKEVLDASDKIARADLAKRLAKYEKQQDINKKSAEAAKKHAEEMIRIAKFLDKNFVFRDEIQFTPFDLKKDELRKAPQIIKDFFTKPVIFKIPFTPLLSEPEKAAEEAATDFTKFFLKEVKALTSQPTRVDFTLPQALIDEKKLKAAQDKLGAIFGVGKDNVFTKAQKEAVFAAQTISGILTPAFSGLFDAIKSGEQPLKAFFKSLAQSVTDLVQKLIQAAIQAAILSAIFPGGVNGVKGFGSLFKNILGFAQGGIVSGPTLALIGEGVGTSRSNPEIVAPLDQLRSMLADLGGGGQTVVVMGRIRGSDIRLQQDRTARRQRRTTGR